MRRMVGSLGLGLVLVTVLAGCGKEAGGSPGAPPAADWVPPPAAPSATASPTAPAPSRVEAAQRYLDAVRPYNGALEDLEQAVNTGQSLATQQELAARTADALQQELVDLRAVAWPPDVAPHIEELLADSERALPHWRRAAQAPTVEELVDAVRAAAEFGGTQAGTAIRDLLELDRYDEGDY